MDDVYAYKFPSSVYADMLNSNGVGGPPGIAQGGGAPDLDPSFLQRSISAPPTDHVSTRYQGLG